jgi:ABC-2 type transport system permease protein
MKMLFFQLRNELWKLFGKKRTYIGFGILLAAQFLISTIFRYTHMTRPLARVLEHNGYIAAPYLSVLTIATYMLIPLNDLLVPLFASLVGGDLVAKESEDGTLRMILARPISRIRLLMVKWLAGFVFSVTLITSLGLFGLLSAEIYFPWGKFFYWNPILDIFGAFDGGEGLQRYCAAHLLMVLNTFFILSLAFMISCFNVKPAAATILALSFLFMSFTFEKLFPDYQAWFLTYHAHLWQWFFLNHIPWWQVGESVSILSACSVTFLVVGCAVFQMRDFKT